MIPFFKVGSTIATSSSIESEFANIKGRVFKNELPLRIDTFIIHHLDYMYRQTYQGSLGKLYIINKTLNFEKTVNIDKTYRDENIKAIPNDVLNASTSVTALNEYENLGGLDNIKNKKKSQII